MDPWNKELLQRASVDSRSLIDRARQSCEDTARHIDQSRAAVAQSLELLLARFTSFGSDKS